MLLNYSVISGLSDEELVLLTHGDSVESNEVAEDFKVIANSGNLVAGLSHFVCYVCLSLSVYMHAYIDL